MQSGMVLFFPVYKSIKILLGALLSLGRVHYVWFRTYLQLGCQDGQLTMNTVE